MFCSHNFHIRQHFFAVGLFSKFRVLCLIFQKKGKKCKNATIACNKLPEKALPLYTGKGLGYLVI